MPPKVTVILPVYNRSGSLEDSMRSVLNQSFRDLELIVVDDASTEDLRPIVAAVADPRVRYIRQARNGGASVARNAGLAAAKGEYIAFQDSDDLWLPGKLKAQMAMLQAAPADVGVVTGSKVLYGSGPDGSYGVGKVSMRPPPASILKPGEDQVRKYLSKTASACKTPCSSATAIPTRCGLTMSPAPTPTGHLPRLWRSTPAFSKAPTRW